MIIRWIPAAMIALATAGCTPARIAVPNDIATESEVILVTDRSRVSGALADESMSIGPYRVSEVDRKWTTTAGWSVLGFGSSTSTGGYAYAFKAPGGAARGECTTGVDSRGSSAGTGDVMIGIRSRVSQLACRCTGAAANAELLLEGAAANKLSGRAEARGEKYTIEAISTLEGGASMGEPMGFQMRSSAAAAGAVETIHPGRLWLARSLPAPAKDDLACLVAGLLLYKPSRR